MNRCLRSPLCSKKNKHVGRCNKYLRVQTTPAPAPTNPEQERFRSELRQLRDEFTASSEELQDHFSMESIQPRSLSGFHHVDASAPKKQTGRKFRAALHFPQPEPIPDLPDGFCCFRRGFSFSGLRSVTERGVVTGLR